MENQYKIILDTNILWHDDGPLDKIMNTNPKDMSDFVVTHDLADRITLQIPEIVVEERVTQRFEDISKVTSSIESGLKRLSVFGVKNSRLHKKDYRKILKKKLLEEIEGLNIKIIPLPKVSHAEILKRSLVRKKPFGKGDTGYKDTLLWFSLLGEARKNKNINIILCTENISDFDIKTLESEFEKISHKKLRILSSSNQVKEFLDKEFNLSLDLKELHKAITNDVKTYCLGDIMVNINASLVEQETADSFSLRQVTRASSFSITNYGGATTDEREIVGYNFRDINIKNISGTGPYVIEAEIGVQIKYRGMGNTFRRSIMFYDGITELHQTIFVKLTYDAESKAITYQESRRGFTWGS